MPDRNNLLSATEAHDLAARGEPVPAYVIFKYGENANVGTSAEAVWRTGGAYPYRLHPAASAVRVRAGDAADSSGGTGAREVVVEGLLAGTFRLARATLTTNGTSASVASSISFARIFRAFVGECGSSASNVGEIIVETTGGVALASIGAGLGQSQMCFYTIPDGYDGFLYSVRATTDMATGTGFVTLDVFKRHAVQDSDAIRLVHRQRALVREHVAYHEWPAGGFRIPGKTDVWLEAKASIGSAYVTGDLVIIVTPKVI